MVADRASRSLSRGIVLAGCLAAAVLGSSKALAAGFTLDGAFAEVHALHPESTRVSEVIPAGVRADENVEFATIDGAALKLDLYRPDDAALRPLMVIVHGGGWESGDRRMEKGLALRLAEIGYAASLVDYRLGPAGVYPKGVDDIKRAISWLKAHSQAYGIDQAHVAIMGGSAGGHLSALIAAEVGEGDASTDKSWWVAGAVDIDGLADFTDPAMLAQQDRKPSSPTRFLGGAYRHRPLVWRDASPLFHVNPHSAPTLFIRSTSRSPLLPGREKMVAQLRKLGIPTDFIVFPNTPHPFWLFDPWQKGIVKDTDDFLRVRLGWPVPALPAVKR